MIFLGVGCFPLWVRLDNKNYNQIEGSCSQIREYERSKVL